MAGRQKLRWYDNASKVGRRIRAAREAAGLTQRDLASENCSAAYISLIEKGDRVPSLQLIREFATQLGVGESYLARGVEDPPPSQELFGLAEARVALRLGEIEVAGEIADAALSRARSDAERAGVSAFLGEVALANGDYEQAVDSLERARKLDPAIESRSPDAADALGRAYARRYEYAAAVAVFTRARDLAAETGDRTGIVRFGSLLAHAYTDAVNFPAAEEALVGALGAAEGLEDPLSLARALWAQSRLHALQNDSDTAARYAERALEILEVSDYSYYTALAHQLLAHIELDRGNGERAAELLESAAPLIAESARAFERASFEVERARTLLALGRQEEAASVAMAAASTISGESSVDAGRCYLLIADVFRDLEDEERALEMYELAVETLEAVPNRYLVEAYSRFAELLEARGDAARALKVLKQAMQVQTESNRMLTPRG
jgi:tetratricopeptide (TPR) repeat protein